MRNLRAKNQENQECKGSKCNDNPSSDVNAMDEVFCSSEGLKGKAKKRKKKHCNTTSNKDTVTVIVTTIIITIIAIHYYNYYYY